MFRLLHITGGVVIVLFACSRADAIFSIKVTAADGTTSVQYIAFPLGSSDFRSDGKEELRGAISLNSYNLQWDFLLDYDHPALTGPLSIKNTSSGPETFSVSFSFSIIPSSAQAGFRVIGASGISVADANSDRTALLAAPSGSAVYMALTSPNTTGSLDPEVLLQPMFSAPYELTTNALGGALADVQLFDDLPLTAALHVVGIQHNFVLSPGDTANFNSTVGVVPEPSAATLAVVALICASVMCRVVFRRRDAMRSPRRGSSQ